MVLPHGLGASRTARCAVASVGAPYALKAEDAEALGGFLLSAFVLTSTADCHSSDSESDFQNRMPHYFPSRPHPELKNHQHDTAEYFKKRTGACKRSMVCRPNLTVFLREQNRADLHQADFHQMETKFVARTPRFEWRVAGGTRVLPRGGWGVGMPHPGCGPIKMRADQ